MNAESSIGLRWTGHAVIDMGVAAATLEAGVNRPEEVGKTQWVGLMQRLEDDYIDGLFKKATQLLQMNAFDNPAWVSKPEKRTPIVNEAFALCRKETEPLEAPCIFFSEQPARQRLSRTYVPMALAEDQLNFYRRGVSGYPVSALAFGCLLALPLVAQVVEGRFMIVGTDDRELLLDLCELWRQQLEKDRGVLRTDKKVVVRSAPRTRLVEALNQVYNEAGEAGHDENNHGTTAGIALYHLTNYGPGPVVQVYTAAPHILSFVRRARSAKYQPMFSALTRPFWRDITTSLDKKKERAADEWARRRNLVYDDLLELPKNAGRFLRYFRSCIQNRVGIEEKLEVEDRDLWPLAELFLIEVMHMKQERIGTIRRLADELAQEVVGNNDKSLYRNLMGTSGGRDSYTFFQQLLVRTVRKRLERGEEPLLTLDDYLLAFEEGEEFPHADWRLARSLLRLRFLEKLHELDFGFLSDSSEDANPEENQTENEEAKEEALT